MRLAGAGLTRSCNSTLLDGGFVRGRYRMLRRRWIRQNRFGALMQVQLSKSCGARCRGAMQRYRCRGCGMCVFGVKTPDGEALFTPVCGVMQGDGWACREFLEVFHKPCGKIAASTSHGILVVASPIDRVLVDLSI
eukprot:13904428-Alexandrium_andersonii.AAC.1